MVACLKSGSPANFVNAELKTLLMFWPNAFTETQIKSITNNFFKVEYLLDEQKVESKKESPQRRKGTKKHKDLFSLFFFVKLRAFVSSWQ
jgi:hypothetical protein